MAKRKKKSTSIAKPKDELAFILNSIETAKIVIKAVAELIPYARNVMDHDDDDVAAICASIKKFGFTQAVLIDDKGEIVAGHGRVLALQELGVPCVPCRELGYLTPALRRAYRIADNQLARKATYNKDNLALEIAELKAANFDIDVLGFNRLELALFTNDGKGGTEGKTDPDDVPSSAPERAKLGDIWQLGNHRIMCGDATSPEAINRLMGTERVDMVFTDPPYGIGHNGGFGVDGAAKANTYRPIANDESVQAARDALRLCQAMGCTLIFWGANYYATALTDNSAWIVWNKQTVGDRFADCELAWVSKPGRVRMFDHQWHGMIKASERGQARVHPTQKPTALAEWCFAEYGDPKTVLDLFLGSGSTLIAAEKTGRRCFGMEIDPKYVDAILARWEAFSGGQATILKAAEPKPKKKSSVA